MNYEWDGAKAEANYAKHGVRFEAVAAFDWNTAVKKIDDRADYGEDRYTVTGLIGTRVHVLVYTLRGDNLRVIGLRKANSREVKRYEQAQA